MKFFQYLFLAILVISAFPLGILLAKLTKEELKQGRKAFIAIIIASIVVIVATLFIPLGKDSNLFLIVSMLFLFIMALISLKRALSYKERLRRKK